MIKSDAQSKEVRERDYKYHKENFATLIARLGAKFQDRGKSQQDPNLTASSIANEDEDPLAIFQKYEVFIPELNVENIDVLINLFGSIGLNTTNHNYLALLRYFHKFKYK